MNNGRRVLYEIENTCLTIKIYNTYSNRLHEMLGAGQKRVNMLGDDQKRVNMLGDGQKRVNI